MRTSSVLVAACAALAWGCGQPTSTTDDGVDIGKASGGKSGGSQASGGSSGSGPSSSGGSTTPAPSSGGGTTGGTTGSEPGTGGSAGSAGDPDAAAPTDTAAPSADGSSPSADPGLPGAFPGCPNCKSIFDGKTLTGWTAVDEVFAVKEGAIASTGKARGFLHSNADYQNFRLIFSNKLISAGHAQNMLLWCQKPFPNNACDGIQFQPPGGSMWDYRAGIDKNVLAANKMKVGTSGAKNNEWSQCEILAKGTTGEFRVACCPLGTMAHCKGTEILKYHDTTLAGAKGPIAWQAHNPGHLILWKDIFIEENPTVDDLITTK